MPEGDTVWRTARRLDQALAGAVVVLSDLRFPSVATTDLRGSTTVEVVSRGKHLLHRFDNGLTLHSHLRMEGQWRVAAPGDTAGWLRRDDLRAAVGTDSWTALGLRLGMLDLVPTAEEASVVGHLGPDLLGRDWDRTTALANLRSSDTTIGAALLDQRNLAGLGTLWASEALFLSRLGPWTHVTELADPALEGLVTRAQQLLDQARHHAIQASTGTRRHGEESYVHGRSGRPCRRCGTTVRVAMIGPAMRERTMFYCPGCQGGLGPSDDGRPQRPLGASAGRGSKGTARSTGQRRG
ncbi:endonuclease-8 [Phycicoccus badiiscoriae]|uniref:DNA-(apurinic or apyrimidinic site) lyase n=1 Tax=Pedococcus badiiscoriae TaxID=642776 RepID=A0A852WKD6_9MICO|nr:endonuclease-8 [Pedococcus badiiscoriae]